MHDRPQMPPPPEGCVYGPWWDEFKQTWFCRNERGVEHYCFLGQWQLPRSQGGTNRELLRLAKELEQKEARIKELKAGLAGCVASMKTLNWCVEYGRTDYHQVRLDKAEALLKGGQDA